MPWLEGMKRRGARIAAVVLFALSGTACGGDQAAAPTSTATPTSTTSGPAGSYIDAEVLAAGLLTVEDLGAPWEQTQRDVFRVREPENPSIDPSLWCPESGAEVLVALAGDTGADVELAVAGTAYMVRMQAWSDADVAEYFAAVTSAVTACAGVSWQDEDATTYTLTPSTTAPEIGADAIGWTVTIDLREVDLTYPAYQTVVRIGEVILVVQGGERPTQGPAATVADYARILELAVTKMRALVSG